MLKLEEKAAKLLIARRLPAHADVKAVPYSIPLQQSTDVLRLLWCNKWKSTRRQTDPIIEPYSPRLSNPSNFLNSAAQWPFWNIHNEHFWESACHGHGWQTRSHLPWRQRQETSNSKRKHKTTLLLIMLSKSIVSYSCLTMPQIMNSGSLSLLSTQRRQAEKARRQRRCWSKCSSNMIKKNAQENAQVNIFSTKNLTTLKELHAQEQIWECSSKTRLK